MIEWLLLPLIVIEGRKVRAKAGRLAPPRGPLTGAVDGQGAPIRLLIVGDSSAAGVGVETTSQCLAPELAGELNRLSGRPVAWRMAGSNSATAGQVRDHVVPHLAREPWSHILLTIGTNDAKNFHTASRFKREFGTLLYALKARFPDAAIVWSPVIDMHDVPALTPFLAGMLQRRAARINAVGAQLCFERYAVAAAPLPVHDPSGFATDGFHASAEGYRAWAAHVAPVLLGAG